MIIMVEHTCKKCGHEWKGKEDPKSCPKCKRYDWKDENKDGNKNRI